MNTMKRLQPASALGGCFQKLAFPEITSDTFFNKKYRIIQPNNMNSMLTTHILPLLTKKFKQKLNK